MIVFKTVTRFSHQYEKCRGKISRKIFSLSEAFPYPTATSSRWTQPSASSIWVARRARKTTASKKRAFNGRRNLSRRQNTGPECVLSVRWIILLPFSAPPPSRAFSSGGGWEALIGEQEVIENLFLTGISARRLEIETGVISMILILLIVYSYKKLSLIPFFMCFHCHRDQFKQMTTCFYYSPPISGIHCMNSRSRCYNLYLAIFYDFIYRKYYHHYHISF